jgi:hypothetical protein
MEFCKESDHELPKLHREKSLMLCCHSFQKWGGDGVGVSFTYKSSAYVGYELQQQNPC